MEKGQTIRGKLNNFHFKFKYAARNDFSRESPAEQACPVHDGIYANKICLF